MKVCSGPEILPSRVVQLEFKTAKKNTEISDIKQLKCKTLPVIYALSVRGIVLFHKSVMNFDFFTYEVEVRIP